MNNKTICPNCGAEGTAGRYCEFCGTKIPMPKPKRKKTKIVETSFVRMVDFKLNQDEAIKAFLYKLSKVENLPKDAFEKLEIKEVTPYLVPTYYYHCNFSAPWSCVKLVYEKYKVGNETKTITKRYPMNGYAQESYSYVLPACAKEAIPVELYIFISSSWSNIAYYTDYYDFSNDYELDEKDKSILVESSGDDADMVLKNSDYCAFSGGRIRSAIRRQLPNDYEDLSYSYTSHHSSGKKLILPFWLIKYSYKNENYYFVIDGVAENDELKKPEDLAKKAEIDKLKKKAENKGLLSLLVSLLWFLAFGCSVTIIVIMFDSERGYYNFTVSWFFIGLVILYYAMHWADRVELNAENAVRSNEYSLWLHRNKSLLTTLSNRNFMLSAEMTKQMIHEIKQKIKEKAPNLKKEDKQRLSKWPTIIVELVGWITLLWKSI